MKNIFSHLPVLNEYLKNKLDYTHNFVIPTLPYNICDYYSLDIGNSSADNEFKQIYDAPNNKNFGGKYNLFLSVPVFSPTADPIAFEASDRGIKTSDSTSKTVLLDPKINITPQIGDILTFKLSESYEVLYEVSSMSKASFLNKDYSQLTLTHTVTNKNILNSKLINIKIFMYQYHKLFSQEEGKMLLLLNSKLNEIIKKLNNLYDKNLDFHTYDKNSLYVFPEIDYYLNSIHCEIEKHTIDNFYTTWRNFEDIDLSILENIFKLNILPLEIYNITKLNRIRENISIKEHLYLTQDVSNEELLDCDFISEIEKLNHEITNTQMLFNNTDLINLSQDENNLIYIKNHLAALKLINNNISTFINNKYDSFYFYLKNSNAENLFELILFLKNILFMYNKIFTKD